MSKLIRLFKKRTIPVSFLSSPDAPLDTSLFDSLEYLKISKQGLSIKGIHILHSASVHYFPKHRDKCFRRYWNSYLDIFHNLSDTPSDGLFLNGGEGAEFQAKSSEVLAVGLCISLACRLFDVKVAQVSVIEGSGKRCDFSLIKGGLEYLIESKGRKGSLTKARSDIYSKKLASDPLCPKYGFLSRLPRDGQKVDMEVIDPEYIPREVPRNELIQRLLDRYARLAYSANFWRLGDELNRICTRLSNGENLSLFENVPLDYGNVLKFGDLVTLEHDGARYLSFDEPHQEFHFFPSLNEFRVISFISEDALNLLSQQNYEALLDYDCPEFVSEDLNKPFSVLSDGSAIAMLKSEV